MIKDVDRREQRRPLTLNSLIIDIQPERQTEKQAF
jgi:hypothetical protein